MVLHYAKVGSVQGYILEAYQNDFSKHALLWLQDSGLIRKVVMVTAGRVPLKAYEEIKSFKLYHLDIGLLRYMSELSPSSIIDSHVSADTPSSHCKCASTTVIMYSIQRICRVEKTAIFKEFKGALTEQFVLQELALCPEIRNLYYWTSPATAEVDFLFDYMGHVIPVEAKAGVAVHAQSLTQFRKKYQPGVEIITSLRNLNYREGILNIPLVLLWNLAYYLNSVFEIPRV